MNIYWITKRIAQGRRPFLPENYQLLHHEGVTHILDLTGSDFQYSSINTKQIEIIQEHVKDYQIIPLEQMIRCLNAMHHTLTQAGTKLYIHCSAGHGRSPTILWLYLTACGINSETAKDWIKSKNLHAKPGSDNLIDHSHLPHAQQHGKRHGWSEQIITAEDHLHHPNTFSARKQG